MDAETAVSAHGENADLCGQKLIYSIERWTLISRGIMREFSSFPSWLLASWRERATSRTAPAQPPMVGHIRSHHKSHKACHWRRRHNPPPSVPDASLRCHGTPRARCAEASTNTGCPWPCSKCIESLGRELPAMQLIIRRSLIQINTLNRNRGAIGPAGVGWDLHQAYRLLNRN